MKITESQLRKIIREHIVYENEGDLLLRQIIREMPQSDEELINEGILDFFSGIFKAFLALFGIEIAEQSSQSYEGSVKYVERAASEAGLEGMGWKDLDPNNPDHAPVLAAAAQASILEALEGLSGALKGMMDVPPLPKKPESEGDDSATKEYKASEGKMKAGAAALGRLLGVIKFLGDKFPTFKKAHDEAAANPPTAPIDVFYQAGGLAQVMLDSDVVKQLDENSPGKKGTEGEAAETSWAELDEAELMSQHHQVIAAALLLMPEDKAIKFISSDDIDGETRTDIIQKMTPIKKIPADVMKDLGDTLGLDLPGEDQQTDGFKLAVKLLKGMGQEKESGVFAHLEGRDMELAEHLRGLMFVFKDIIGLQDKEIQLIFGELEDDQIIPALVGMDEEFQNNIMSNVSSGRAEKIRNMVSQTAKSGIKDDDKKVQEARANIVEIIMNLAEEGKVNPRPEQG